MRHFIASALIAFAWQLFALEVPPPPTQWVTDRAGILSASDLESLNQKLRAFEERSGNQFIIYIFKSLEGEALEDFTIRAAERWKVGQKKYDNGLILFVFVEDRKTRIETGYGLEPVITDAFSSRVLRETIPPYFRRGDYAGGLHAAADQLIARIEGKEPPAPTAPRAQKAPSGWVWADLLFLVIILLVFFMIVAPLSRRRGCGGCLLPLGGGGVTFGGSGGGGGWSGGGFSGGFSGGGGSFGGGGASGSW
jgi:uncharacterized protein